MSSYVTSTSTDAEVDAAIEDNASWAVERSVVKARSFAVACRVKLNRLAAELSKGGERVRLDENLRQLRAELAEAQAYINASTADASGSVRIRRPSW